MNVPVRLERPAPQWLLGVVALPRRLRNYTILVCVVGTMVFTANITLLWLDPEPRTRQFLLVLFLCVCIACTRGIQVRRGAEYHPYQFWEYPAIVGLALAPPYLVGTCLTGVFAVQQVYVYFALPEMRPRIPVAFGSMAVVATVWTFAGATLPPVSYVAAFVLGALVLDLFLYGYDYFSAGSRYALEALRDDWAKRMAIPIGLSAVVAAMVHFIGPHRQFLMITPLTLLILYWIIQWQLALASDQRAWRQMEAISSKFIGELDEHTVISVALYESLKLFTASRVEIMLPESLNESGARWYLEMGPGKQIAVEMLPEIGTPPDDESAVPRDPRLVRKIPLKVGDRTFGHMIVTWSRIGQASGSQIKLVHTLAHAVAASLANTRHNMQISAQAAEKAREAQHDPLTGLGNRSMLLDLGPSVLVESDEVGRHAALLLLDLDGFKRINDTLGHAAGDVVLKEVAHRIRGHVRRSDLSIRLGGDEFAILAHDMSRPADAKLLANKIARALLPPIQVEGLDLTVECSMGIAVHRQDADSIETLLKMADIAMYQAKARGRSQAVRYSRSIDVHSTEALLLATDLRRAINASNELVLHYQPQIDLAQDKVIGVEALVRWQHPTLGMLPPVRFVPLAEHSGLVRQFTLAIIDMALADRARMREVLPRGTVSVNLSGRNLLDSSLSIDVKRALERHGVSAQELVIEVTETTTPADTIAADRVLSDLSRLGCRISMDDFGSGYATLESMRAGSPISEIKIDRGFIRDIVPSARAATVAEAMIRIAHAWDCRVVAEGVEDAATVDLLRQMGCDVVQGFHILRPAPLAEVLGWVSNRGNRQDARVAEPDPARERVDGPVSPSRLGRRE